MADLLASKISAAAGRSQVGAEAYGKAQWGAAWIGDGSRGRKHAVGGCLGGEISCHLGSCDAWHSFQTVAASAAPELNFSGLCQTERWTAIFQINQRNEGCLKSPCSGTFS